MTIAQSTEGSNSIPRASVVIPLHKEGAGLRLCLDSLLQQDYPPHMLEIIVVDGDCDQSTRELVEEYAGRATNPIRYLQNPQRTTPTGLNIGIKTSTGEIVFIVSGHCELGDSYIRECCGALKQSPTVGCAGGRVVAIGMSPESRLIAQALSHPFGIGNARFRYAEKTSYADTVAYAGYKREVFAAIGFFNEHLTRNQDIEFNARLRRHGFKALLVGSALAKYHVRRSIPLMAKQAFDNGLWNIRTQVLCAGSLSLRHFVPLLFVLSLLLFATGGAFGVPHAWHALIIESLLYLTVASLAALKPAGRIEGSSNIALVPVFGTLHLSYGLGSLCGLIEAIFASRRKTRTALRTT